MQISVPCYNEQEALPIFYKEITGALNQTGGGDVRLRGSPYK